MQLIGEDARLHINFNVHLFYVNMCECVRHACLCVRVDRFLGIKLVILRKTLKHVNIITTIGDNMQRF